MISTSESEDDHDDYIVMEIQHDSPLEPIEEFEFPRFSSSFDEEEEEDHRARTSPADELFYMGNLLPLNLTPRIEMVQKIFEQNLNTKINQQLEEFLKSENTMFDSSCKVSPSECCQVSRELNKQECFLECSNSLIKEKKSWTKKVMKWAKTTTLGEIRQKKVITGSSRFMHRWSFSFRMESKTNCHLQVVKRSLSSESENPIQPAIAHCKRSLKHLILVNNKDYSLWI